MLKMPRGDQVDNMSLGAHRLLHRSCRGKAHASGIGKQNSQLRGGCAQQWPRSPLQDHQSSKQHEAYVGRLDRKHSRNSTSSWECSDSDSMHSSEVGQNGGPVNRTPSVKSAGKDRSRECRASDRYSPRAARNAKKECWADTLRAGYATDVRIRRMEQGWDDSNVIRTPKERKWHRITADVEQRVPHQRDNGCTRVYGLRSSWPTSSKKASKRSRPAHQRCAIPIQDIVEWEELFELALARKIRRKIRGKRTVDGTSAKQNGGENGAKDEDKCMKRLEVLLESRVTPQIDEVHAVRTPKNPTGAEIISIRRGDIERCKVAS